MTRPQRVTRDIRTRAPSASEHKPRLAEPSGSYSVIRPGQPFDVALIAARDQARATADRDRQIMADAFDALLTRERQAALSWAREFLMVGGARFRGSLDDIRKLHAYHPMVRVEQMISREQEIAATRKRMGAL